MATFTSHSPEETFQLGESWGTKLRAGSVLALQGDLGAGKTQLVKGIARGMGLADRIHSPTFALLNTYSDGPMSLFHLDLYRLDSRSAIVGAGLEEFLFAPKGVTVVEWPERWLLAEENHAKPPSWLWVTLEAPEETLRIIRYDGLGS